MNGYYWAFHNLIFPRKIVFQGGRKINAMAFECIGVFYNRKRLHSALGYILPMLFMNGWLRSQP